MFRRCPPDSRSPPGKPSQSSCWNQPPSRTRLDTRQPVHTGRAPRNSFTPNPTPATTRAAVPRRPADGETRRRPAPTPIPYASAPDNTPHQQTHTRTPYAAKHTATPHVPALQTPLGADNPPPTQHIPAVHAVSPL